MMGKQLQAYNGETTPKRHGEAIQWLVLLLLSSAAAAAAAAAVIGVGGVGGVGAHCITGDRSIYRH